MSQLRNDVLFLQSAHSLRQSPGAVCLCTTRMWISQASAVPLVALGRKARNLWLCGTLATCVCVCLSVCLSFAQWWYPNVAGPNAGFLCFDTYVDNLVAIFLEFRKVHKELGLVSCMCSGLIYSLFDNPGQGIFISPLTPRSQSMTFISWTPRHHDRLV